MKKREEWSSRMTFILAAIGSAVGLGNAWRFPGLAAKYGGGAFKSVNKKAEYVGWAATTNAFAIEIYYAVVFAWVLIYACIRKGTVSVGKVVKYTGLTLPLLFLVIMAIKGITMPGGTEGLAKLLIPDYSVISANGLWSSLIIDAIGQVFYSLSIMMAIMIAYGSYLSDSSNIAKDATIIAFADLGVSVLSGIVMFTTMYGVGMTVNDMSSSGIATAFIIFPQAIVNLTKIGWVNAIFGFVFYACLSSLAIDSAFSIVEGVSTALADRLKLDGRKTTKFICIISAVLSIIFITESGLAWLDIVDNWTNQYNMIIIGAMECIVIGWFFKPKKVLEEINKNSNGYKIPDWWFNTSIKFVAPAALIGFGLWNLVSLFKNGGVYGAESGYPLWSNIVGGWAVTFIVFVSGFIAKAVINHKKKNGFEDEDNSWS